MATFSLTGGLKGLRILDVSQALAGPFCTQMLADHGADVVKVEPPEGEMARRVGPFTQDDTVRAYGGMFQCCNRNKRGIALDLKHPEGREVFLKMAESADAVVENFRVGVMDRLGLGYETLAERNPRLVYTSIRGFGDPRGGRSPYADWPAVDIVSQAMGGLMGLTGPDAHTPIKVGAGPGDAIPGLFAAYATMVALWEARTSGKGQYVDVGMIDSVLAFCEPVTNIYSYLDKVPGPVGNRNPEISPMGAVRAKDGWVAIAVPPGRIWEIFCQAIGRPELIKDPRFATERARVENTDEVYAVVEDFTLRHTKAELSAILGGKVPFGPVYDAADIFADPHYQIRDMLPQVEQPGSARRVTVPGVPPKLTRTPGGVHVRAPLLGEHTDEVLAALGFGEEQLTQLRKSGAIA
ncbi:CoA transferase [Magnetospirillum sp. 15-1]|uniref:CaiB/BaiF CoA transferase family protein n=1 Tax=Magnetospirillum sp. 15-1 TaxID=1979370 RepID=UPI000BBC7887|nr:CoA transferase [Magnetospirillum sp. 15-1]